jgi:hypothetical protein
VDCCMSAILHRLDNRITLLENPATPVAAKTGSARVN